MNETHEGVTQEEQETQSQIGTEGALTGEEFEEEAFTYNDPNDSPSETAEVETPEPSSGEEYSQKVQRRMDELTKQRKTEETAKNIAIREKLRVEQELAALQAKVAAGDEPVPPSPGEFTDEYGETDWTAHQQAMMEHQQKLAQWQQAQGGWQPEANGNGGAPVDPMQGHQPQQPQLPPEHVAWIEKEKAFAQANPDYMESVKEIREVVTDDMADYLVNAGEQGPAVAYFLAKNPEQLYELIGQGRMGQIEGLVAIKNKLNVQRRIKSNAPPPPETIDGSGAPAGEKDLSKMSTKEFMAHRNKQERQRRGLPH